MILYAPIVLTNTYIAGVFLLTLVGPVVYFEFSAGLVFLYLFAICISMTIGYFWAVKTPIVQSARFAVTTTRSAKRMFQFFLWSSVFGSMLYLVLLTYQSGLNLSFSEVGNTYVEGYKEFSKNDGNYEPTFVLYSLMVLPSLYSFIWGVVFFKNIRAHEKMGVLWVVLLYPMILTLSAGTQKNIGDAFIYLTTAMVFIFIRRRKAFGLKNVLLVLFVALLTVTLLVSILNLRYEAAGIGANNINQSETVLLAFDLDHPIFHLFGYQTGFGLAVLTVYLTNGFNGLSYALTSEPTWSFMLGSAYPMSVIGERVFGLPSGYLNSYPYLAGEASGWGDTRWYSVFSWFASDFSFVGTIPLFGFFAYVYGRAWKEVTLRANPFAIVIVGMLNLGIVMIPANNQLMQSPGGLFALIVAFTIYLRFRKQANVFPVIISTLK